MSSLNVPPCVEFLVAKWFHIDVVKSVPQSVCFVPQSVCFELVIIKQHSVFFLIVLSCVTKKSKVCPILNLIIGMERLEYLSLPGPWHKGGRGEVLPSVPLTPASPVVPILLLRWGASWGGDHDVTIRARTHILWIDRQCYWPLHHYSSSCVTHSYK